MNLVEMWWLSVPFAVVLCLILSWLSTGDDDINIHDSTIMRVSLRTSPPSNPRVHRFIAMRPDFVFFSPQAIQYARVARLLAWPN